MSSETAIRVDALSKCYQIYDKPEHRLLQMLLRGRKRYYREFWALKGVSFDVAKGETVAIIGRNGSGKSTLLQLVCGMLDPTAGDLSVSGKIAALLELGAGFNVEFTGRDNVYLNGALLGIDHAAMDARFGAIADFADIDAFLDQPVKTYSSGMYIRLAFAVAIHCDPQILVVDEALAVGDFLFQQKCNLFLKERLSGITKLLVTHDLGAVTNLAHRALVLHHGELIHDGDPSSAIREYQVVARAEERRKVHVPGIHVPGIHVPEIDVSKIDVSKIQVPKIHVSTPTPNGVCGPQAGISPQSLPQWIPVPPTHLSGALRARIIRCAWAIDGLSNPDAVRDGETVRIDFEVWADEQIPSAIIGYQCQDRFGNVVFGENSITSNVALGHLQKGLSRFSLELIWPQIASGTYAVTLGIGSGHDSLAHVVECWAHNAFVINSSASAPIHGVFNVKITRIDVHEPS